MKRKRSLMNPEDESLFKKHIKRHAEHKFVFFLTVNIMANTSYNLAIEQM